MSGVPESGWWLRNTDHHRSMPSVQSEPRMWSSSVPSGLFLMVFEYGFSSREVCLSASWVHVWVAPWNSASQVIMPSSATVALPVSGISKRNSASKVVPSSSVKRKRSH